MGNSHEIMIRQDINEKLDMYTRFFIFCLTIKMKNLSNMNNNYYYITFYE